jgi:hypothetical protein
MALDHRAHGAIEYDNAFAQKRLQGMRSSGILPGTNAFAPVIKKQIDLIVMCDVFNRQGSD